MSGFNYSHAEPCHQCQLTNLYWPSLDLGLWHYQVWIHPGDKFHHFESQILFLDKQTCMRMRWTLLLPKSCLKGPTWRHKWSDHMLFISVKSIIKVFMTRWLKGRLGTISSRNASALRNWQLNDKMANNTVKNPQLSIIPSRTEEEEERLIKDCHIWIHPSALIHPHN
jgi:hypothetical protein